MPENYVEKSEAATPIAENELKTDGPAVPPSINVSSAPAPEPVLEEIPLTPITPEELVKTAESGKKRGRGRPPLPRDPNGNPIRAGASGSEINDPQPAESLVTAIPQVNYALMSQMFFDTGTGALSVAFGEEWKARSPEEREHVCIALATYLRSKEVKDIPPGLMLTIVLLAYSAPRLQEPSTSGKIKGAVNWIKTKIFRRKLKQQISVVPNNPEP